MITSEASVTFEGEFLICIKGVVSEFHFARSKENLLEKILDRKNTADIAVGVIAALSEMHGVAASSLSLGLYDGEDTFNFTGIVNGKVIFGSFSNANQIENGDLVTLIVSSRGDANYIHGLSRDRDGLMMLPGMVFAGKRAYFKSCMKFARIFCVATWIFLFVSFYFAFGVEYLGRDGFVYLIAMAVFIPVLVWFPMEYWTYKSTRYYAGYASAIFTAFGYPRPDDLDIRTGMSPFPDKSYGFIAINCNLALMKHRKKYRILSGT